MDAQSDCIVRHTVCSSLVCWKCEGHFARTCNSKLVCDEALRFALSYHWEEQSTTRLCKRKDHRASWLRTCKTNTVVIICIQSTQNRCECTENVRVYIKCTPRSIIILYNFYFYLFKIDAITGFVSYARARMCVCVSARARAQVY